MKIGYEPPPGACYLPELDPLNQPRPYARVSFDGSSCVMELREAEAMQREAPGVYTVEEVMLSQNQFEALPEFGGW